MFFPYPRLVNLYLEDNRLKTLKTFQYSGITGPFTDVLFQNNQISEIEPDLLNGT